MPMDSRFVNQIPAARSYSGFNVGDDGDIFLRSLPEVHQDVTTLPWNSPARARKILSQFKFQHDDPRRTFRLTSGTPGTQTGDKILLVMTERVIENHTSFYLDILFGGNAFLKRYQNRVFHNDPECRLSVGKRFIRKIHRSFLIFCLIVRSYFENNGGDVYILNDYYPFDISVNQTLLFACNAI